MARRQFFHVGMGVTELFGLGKFGRLIVLFVEVIQTFLFGFFDLLFLHLVSQISVFLGVESKRCLWTHVHMILMSPIVEFQVRGIMMNKLFEVRVAHNKYNL